jgi:antitoxin (DNA-binding transcriptional repressor) of toxin-antitoxin stability system
MIGGRGEVARDLHTVLEKVRQGVEVVVEQDNRPGLVLEAHHPRNNREGPRSCG